MEFTTKQFLLTVAAGKKLIAKAILSLEQIKKALNKHTIVIISGSTNGYIAEEILTFIDQKGDFSKSSFLRGVNVGPGNKIKNGLYSNVDIVIEKGKWIKEKNIFNITDTLGCDDIILKGANAVDQERKLAGIQIGNPTLGTSGPILQAVIGRRTQLIIPIGLEKRVFGNIAEIAAKLNDPSTSGLRMLPISGTIITELEAIKLLSGASAELVAAGGVLGAEGSCWIAVSGTKEQLEVASNVLNSIKCESIF